MTDNEKDILSSSRYNAGIDKLAKLVKIEGIFDPKIDDLKTIFYQFYDFATENLDLLVKKGFLPNAHFIYSSNYSLNGAATLNKDQYILAINCSIISKLYEELCIDNPLVKLNELQEIEQSIGIGTIMYQAAVQYTYFHEKAHLVQLSINSLPYVTIGHFFIFVGFHYRSKSIHNLVKFIKENAEW